MYSALARVLDHTAALRTRKFGFVFTQGNEIVRSLLAGIEGAQDQVGEFRVANELPPLAITEMRGLGRLLAPKQEKDQDTDDDRQDAADEDQPVRHSATLL